MLHGILTARGRRDCERYGVDPNDIDDVLNANDTQTQPGREEYDYWFGRLSDGRLVELACTREPPILVHRVTLVPEG